MKIAVIGAGAMGGSLAEGLLSGTLGMIIIKKENLTLKVLNKNIEC